MARKMIITGATGVVGSAVVRKALESEWYVTCIVHEDSKRLANIPLHENVNIIKCNASNYSQLELHDTYDVFVHLSWEKTFGSLRDDTDIQVRNIQYTLDACKLAKRLGCTKFIGAGSQAEYGLKSDSLKPDMPVNPESGYGIAKFAAGKMAALLCAQLGLDYNWVRILSVYGPNDSPNTLISYLITELKAGRSPELTKCEQIWDYLYSDDAGEAFIKIADKGVNGATYVLGSGNMRPLHDYVEDIKNAIDPTIDIKYGAKDYYPHQPMFMVADIKNLTSDTGWLPTFNFSSGIDIVCNCFSKNLKERQEVFCSA